jgi:hypothetical protein
VRPRHPVAEDRGRSARIAEAGRPESPVTQAYAEMSIGPHAPRRVPAPLVHFATWASKQAGQTILTEDLARTSRVTSAGPTPHPQSSSGHRAVRAIRAAPGDGRHRISGAIRERPRRTAGWRGRATRRPGKQKVAEEIGREFALSLPCWRAPARSGGRPIEGFCSALRRRFRRRPWPSLSGRVPLGITTRADATTEARAEGPCSPPAYRPSRAEPSPAGDPRCASTLRPSPVARWRELLLEALLRISRLARFRVPPGPSNGVARLAEVVLTSVRVAVTENGTTSP